ncbi:MAG: PrsW family intramembrane metalloprotease [Chloroflexi bacterium]|nr:PrsW family intramembrane metalloprotease [Chloroflexota bacterium]
MEGIDWSVALTAGLLAILGAVIPAAIYIVIIWWLDRFEKEPLWLLAFAFLWGAIPANVFAALFNTLFGLPLMLIDPLIGELGTAAVVAPFIEETAKGLALILLVLIFRHEFDDVLDGIIYGAMIGFGFAMTEDFDYFMRAFGEGGWEQLFFLILIRPTLFGIAHAAYTSVTGAGVGLARISGRKWAWFVTVPGAWVVAMSLHAFNNGVTVLGLPGCCLALSSNWLAVLVMLGIILVALIWEARWIREQLAEEVQRGLITAQEYHFISSSWRRLGARFRALTSGGFGAWREQGRLFQLASDLAFKKYQLGRLGDEGRTAADIVYLRAQIADLKGTLDVEAAITCARCGQPLSVNRQFCTACGTWVQGAGYVPTAPPGWFDRQSAGVRVLVVTVLVLLGACCVFMCLGFSTLSYTLGITTTPTPF